MVNCISPKGLTHEKLKKLLTSSSSFVISKDYSKLDSTITNQDSLLNNHIWLSTSGSNRKRLVALSHEALWSSASSVNAWLETSTADHWAIALPLDHIGGLSIVVRSLLANFKISHFLEAWNPHKLCSFLGRERVSLVSLVPTQLFDIVSKELGPPPSIRAVVIGGAKLDKALYLKARLLGWPILPSYGLTECCSQVASACLRSLQIQGEYPALFVLPHLACRVNEERTLEIRGSSLLSAYIETQEDQTLKLVAIDKAQFFKSNDLAELIAHNDRTEIKLLGRSDRQVKIKGWLVSLEEIEVKIGSFLASKSLQILYAIRARSNSREGTELILHISGGSLAERLLEDLNAQLRLANPHSPQISEIIEHRQFPLLANGKINYAALSKEAQHL